MSLWFLIFSTFLFAIPSHGQTKTISGKIIHEDLKPLYGKIKIWNADTLLLAEIEMDSTFQVQIPINTNNLWFSAVSKEQTKINLPANCNYLELILRNKHIHDFTSPEKIDKLRLKQFRATSLLHAMAFNQGIFFRAEPCYKEVFIPIKHELKRIRKQRRSMPGT